MSEAVITKALQNICQELRIQGLTQHIRTFSGEGSAKFAQWLNDMDQISITCDSERMCVLATITLNGSAGAYASRMLKENPQITWSELRRKLKERYSEMTDPYLASEKCRRLKQNRGESVQNFAEKLRTMASEAFENLSAPEAQRFLVEVFQKGVNDDSLARNLIRKRFTNLDDALAFAESEQQADRTFQVCRHHSPPQSDVEPMDCSGIQSATDSELRTTIQNLTSQVQRMSRDIQKLKPQRRAQTAPPQVRFNVPPTTPPPTYFNVPPTAPPQVRFDVPPPLMSYYGNVRTPPQAPQTPRPNYQWTEDGSPICIACGTPGHVRRTCRRNPTRPPPQSTQGNANARLEK